MSNFEYQRVVEGDDATSNDHHHHHNHRPVYIPQTNKRKRKLQQQQQDDKINARVGAYFRFDDTADTALIGTSTTGTVSATNNRTTVSNNENANANDNGNSSSNNNNSNTIYDYMDEQDFNEWGGPHQVRSEFRHDNVGTPPPTHPESQPLHHDELSFLTNKAKPVSSSSLSIGERLLRHWGVRRSSSPHHNSDDDLHCTGKWTIYLPQQPHNINDHRMMDEANQFTATNSSSDNNGTTKKSIDQQYKLQQLLERKIQSRIVQQEAIPWDLYLKSGSGSIHGRIGLGYDSQSLYKTSEFQSLQNRSTPQPPNNPNSHATKTKPSQNTLLSGFAIRDDDEANVYDQNTTKSDRSGNIWDTKLFQIKEPTTALVTYVNPLDPLPPPPSQQQIVLWNTETNDDDHVSSRKDKQLHNSQSEHYEMVAYEHIDSDTEDDHNDSRRITTKRSNINDPMDTFRGALSAWATTNATSSTSNNNTNTYHGKDHPNATKATQPATTTIPNNASTIPTGSAAPISGFVRGRGTNGHLLPIYYHPRPIKFHPTGMKQCIGHKFHHRPHYRIIAMRHCPKMTITISMHQ